MFNVKFGEKVLSFDAPVTVYDAAKEAELISREVLCARVNGKVSDLTTPLSADAEVELLTFDDPDGARTFRHTASHILAEAVKRLYPETKLTIGPAIDEGFYYDFDSPVNFTPDILEKLEAEMKKIVKENQKLEKFVLPRAEALELMKDEPYKVELINDLPADAEISFYKMGEFTDLCAGPHLFSTGAVKAFKLTACNAAYWRGDASRQTLQRIYGTAYPKKDALDVYLQKLEEAKKRDHRKIGKDLQLFMTDDLVGRGMPMFLPKGTIIWHELEKYIRDKEEKLGYQHVLTPCVGTVQLYKTSGHWDHYKENMFPAMQVDEETYVLRPMNCPHHMMIYRNGSHSYRNLPIRIGEIAHDFRYESSGTLKGIERGRHFCQNDAHLFVTPEQIKDEVSTVCDLIFEVYRDFNITDYRCVLSLRDPADKKKYHDDDEMWNTAETALREVLTELGIHFTEEIGEAAFYGPKLDVNVKPAVGAEYTLSTCQLDFCLPAKFQLTYIDSDGSEKTPVVIHRAILGSLDRFMAYLIEETKGKFPVWLAPVQVKVLPVSEKTLDYARTVADKLDEAGLRVVLDTSNEKIGYKIRQAQSEDRVPYMLVLGPKEAESGDVAVRSRTGDEGTMSLEDFIARIRSDIDTKKM